MGNPPESSTGSPEFLILIDTEATLADWRWRGRYENLWCNAITQSVLNLAALL